MIDNQIKSHIIIIIIIMTIRRLIFFLKFFFRFGGQAKLLKDLAYGKTSDDAEFRTAAVWAAGWDAMFNGGVNYFFPIFANQKENHEVRQAALTMIFYSKPSTSDMGRIMAVLQTDTCYETINFAYTIFEQFANTINPCHEQTKGAAAFFLKFMKQYSRLVNQKYI